MSVEKDKWELSITDTLKIQESDAYNFIVLQLKKGKNVKTGEATEGWKLQGYYSTVRDALMGVLHKDLLVDLRAVASLRDYRKETKKQFKLIEELLEGK